MQKKNVSLKMYTNSNTLYTLCTFMKYTFCSIHLELIQKVHIFVHFLYSTWVTWVRFAIYAFCIHLYTFCIASMLPTLIWNRILYKKYTSQKVCLLHHNCFGFNVMYTFYIQKKLTAICWINIIIVYKNYTKYILVGYDYIVLICTWICDFLYKSKF